MRWHCNSDTGFKIRAVAVWGRARYFSVTEAPHNTDFQTWMGKKHFYFFQAAETGNRAPNSGVKGSGANHYPRAPAHHTYILYRVLRHVQNFFLRRSWWEIPPKSLHNVHCDQTFTELQSSITSCYYGPLLAIMRSPYGRTSLCGWGFTTWGCRTRTNIIIL